MRDLFVFLRVTFNQNQIALMAQLNKHNTSPVYRYWNGTDHFYTTNETEIGTTTTGLKGKYGYTCEGTSAYVSSVKSDGLSPVYRYWNGVEHFYTTNAFEIGTDVVGVKGKFGYVCEGILGYAPAAGTAIYRYWNGKEHFYTSNAQEIGTVTQGLKGKYGYVSEGIGFYSLKP